MEYYVKLLKKIPTFVVLKIRNYGFTKRISMVP